jgi:2-polyprenyl-3-methyl-5-hydroxy-6-metoxy-1,4-benzoquinol methylase
MRALDELTDSGERLDPGAEPRTHDEHAHLARYLWASEHSHGRVLDVACGTGYGTALLAATPGVRSVTAIDNVRDAVERTARRVPQAETLCATVPPLPFPDHSFDTVVSMETIEHIDDDRAFAAEVRRVLRPSGSFLLSTPNSDLTSPDRLVVNPWHVREYRLDELLHVLRSGGFERCEVFAQQIHASARVNVLARRILARFPRLCRAERWWDRLGHGDRKVRPWHGEGTPLFWVIRCSGGGA